MKITAAERLVSLETICVLAMIFLAAGLYFKVVELSAAALFLLAIGVFSKTAAAFTARGWLKFSALLGAVNTRIILTAIFYLFLTPLACVYRIFQGDFLRLKNDGAQSMWVDREHAYKPADLEKLW